MDLSRIKLNRMFKGLRQCDLAKMTDLSESQISKIESGRKLLSSDLIARIATALGISQREIEPQQKKAQTKPRWPVVGKGNKK